MPAATPVIMPVVPTVAMEVLLLLQVPPEKSEVNVAVQVGVTVLLVHTVNVCAFAVMKTKHRIAVSNNLFVMIKII